MFSALAEKFQSIFSSFCRSSKLTEDNIQEALAEVRLALLDADVQYGVVKNFIRNVKEKAVGQQLLQSVSPGQLFVKIVHDELVALLGKEEVECVLRQRPAKVILCGLQGSGKTTHSVKLALYFKEKRGFKKPCVVACDLARPAAIEQLKILAHSAGVDFFGIDGEKSPVVVAKGAMASSVSHMWDLMIFDTAGRLHVDEALMDELLAVKNVVMPQETILTINAATGQDAVKTAAAFAEKIGVTGTCLTMLDGSSRGGAAISVVEVTKRPILFEGFGEKLGDVRPFHPVSMADRILGMGDTITLVRTAQEHFSESEAKRLEKKLRAAEFTYADFLQQLHMIQKMGSLKSLMSMIPGFSNLPFEGSEDEMKKTEAMIYSMTLEERNDQCELVPSRRRRIARGSGTTIDDVNRLVKTMKQVKLLFKNAPKMKQLEKMMKGGSLWR